MTTFSFSENIHRRKTAPRGESSGGYACISCLSPTRIVDSRRSHTGDVRRRRKCKHCSLSFYTLESVETARKAEQSKILHSIDTKTKTLEAAAEALLAALSTLRAEH